MMPRLALPVPSSWYAGRYIQRLTSASKRGPCFATCGGGGGGGGGGESSSTSELPYAVPVRTHVHASIAINRAKWR